MIDILNIEPHQVSADLKGYAIGIYGAPGVGKTSTALKASRTLLLACEAGYKSIPGILAADIHSWTDALSVASQLKKPQAIEKFDTIVIDTLDELVFYAEQHVLSSNGAKTLSDIPWGGGYTQLANMFRKFFKDITKNYGLIVIAHASLKIDDDDPDKIKYATLGINKKVKQIVIGLLDILAYIESDRTSNGVSIIHYRSDIGWEAKSRFANIVKNDIFSYENLVKNINDAVKDFATAVHHKDYVGSEEKFEIDEFESLRNEADKIAREKIDVVGMQPVVNLISTILGKKLNETDVADTAALRVLMEEIKRL